MEKLASKGIQIFMPTEASPGATGKRSCASKGVDQQEATAVTEPNMIDLREGIVPCNLVIRLGGYHINVAKVPDEYALSPIGTELTLESE